ncbi:MAG: BioY protein [Cyanobacteria bacterium RYN_339]|nr:BioY protein [Cyanobacteria bacterium RYN_339]
MPRVIRLLLVLFFTSLMASSAFVALKVPFLAPGVPRALPGAEALYQWHGWVFGSHVISAQLPVIWLTGALIGARRGGLAVALYVALGLGGLPIFTNGGGFAYVKQPTFGYLAAFLPAVLLVGINAGTPHFGRIWRGMALGLVAVQGFGLIYEVVLRGQLFSLDGWGVLTRNQVLQFLPGQLALLTATAFAVACWRKLEAAYENWSARRRADQDGPMLPEFDDEPEPEAPPLD